MIAGSLVLVGGLVVFLVARYHNPASEAALPPGPTSAATSKVDQSIDADARRVAGKFLLTAVARKNIGASWDLLDPTFAGKAEYTRKTWAAATGGLPVIPVPDIASMETRFRVKGRSPNSLTLDVLLLPKKGVPLGFDLGLTRRTVGAEKRWLVDYWMTNSDMPVRTDPSAG